jgi:hypothetical protein
MTTLCDSSDDSFCPADCKTDRGSQIYTIFKQKSQSEEEGEEEGDDKSFAILLTTPLSCRLQDRPAA